MLFSIKKLLVRTIIGFRDWEREKKQDVLINIQFEADVSKALESDDVRDTVDYKWIKNRVKDEVESTSFNLLEKLADHIADVVLEDERVESVKVEVDKPHALRYAESVSVVLEKKR